MSENKHKNDKNEVVEEITLKGQEVVERVKELIQQGNVRRIIVRKSNGEAIVDLPLTGAVIGAGVLVVFAAPLAVLAGIAAFLAEVKLEIVRVVEDDADESEQKKKRIEID